MKNLQTSFMVVLADRVLPVDRDGRNVPKMAPAGYAARQPGAIFHQNRNEGRAFHPRPSDSERSSGYGVRVADIDYGSAEWQLLELLLDGGSSLDSAADTVAAWQERDITEEDVLRIALNLSARGLITVNSISEDGHGHIAVPPHENAAFLKRWLSAPEHWDSDQMGRPEISMLTWLTLNKRGWEELRQLSIDERKANPSRAFAEEAWVVDIDMHLGIATICVPEKEEVYSVLDEAERLTPSYRFSRSFESVSEGMYYRTREGVVGHGVVVKTRWTDIGETTA